MKKKIQNMCSHVETDNSVWIHNVTYDMDNDMVFNTYTNEILQAGIKREQDTDMSRRIRRRQAYIKYLKNNELRPEALPKIEIAWDNSIIYPECSICCEDIIDDQKILKCKHAFHKKCIKEWFNYQRNCPYCRSKA